MTSTPHTNNKIFTVAERHYIDATTKELSRRLQRVEIGWPFHEIQEILCKHFDVIKEKKKNDFDYYTHSNWGLNLLYRFPKNEFPLQGKYFENGCWKGGVDVVIKNNWKKISEETAKSKWSEAFLIEDYG